MISHRKPRVSLKGTSHAPEGSSSVPSRRSYGWATAALLLFVIGTMLALVAGMTLANSDKQRSESRLRASAVQIAATLQLAIHSEEDLIVSAGGFVSGKPGASQRQFMRWAQSIQVLKRYPELEGLGHVVVVPASRLAAYAARADKDGLAPNGDFHVVPAGHRPYYCLDVGNIARNALAPFPAGFDFCAGALGTAGLAARSSGQAAYLPDRAGADTFLAIFTPIYRGGAVPRTVAARLASSTGWIGMAVQPSLVLGRALEGRPKTEVIFRYASGSSDVTFHDGTAPRGAISNAVHLHNGWTITTLAATADVGLFGDPVVLALVLSGVLASVLLSVLLFVLGTQRSRAFRLVTDKTSELRHQALHDSLTGLPNRALIHDRIHQLLARNRRAGTQGAALYVDLDGFKNINDTLGHEAGDRLLQAVATRLGASLRDTDTIGRMGGDEFVVLVDGDVDKGPLLVADRILQVMRQPFELSGIATSRTVTASIGIATGDRSSPTDLLRDADIALYQAKAAGRNCFEVFQPEMERELHHRSEIESDLRSALEYRQFKLVYQPIYNLDDLSLAGVEALLRWEHPSLGLVGPDEFIPLLEASGQIVEVGHWVLHEACRQMAEWQAAGYASFGVSVNVSGRQLDLDSIVDHVRDELELSGLPPQALNLEITETALMRNIKNATRRLHELKALGVLIAIDDFGTGYSSLAYLQHFPVDSLKIDKAFTDAISQSPESIALVRTLVNLGRDLGLKTLAEGVETVAQMDHMRDEHVDQAQGFLLAKPLTPDAFERRLLLPTSSQLTLPNQHGAGTSPLTPQPPTTT